MSHHGRLLAIGDIHGHRRALHHLLDAIALTSDDRLILLGDYVESGEDSAGVLDCVQSLLMKGNVRALLGNQEELMRDALVNDAAFTHWANERGRATVASYLESTTADIRQHITRRHGHLLQRLALWHEEPEAIFIHADVDHDVPMHQQRSDVLLWRKPSRRRGHVSGKAVVCGHTPQLNGKPAQCGNVYCIDSAIKHGGWLTCLDVLSLHCWQTRDNGDRRTMTLHPPRMAIGDR